MPVVTRRDCLKFTAATLLLPAGLSAQSGRSWQQYPFTLGVASGCPQSDGFVIWTRLAPDPLCTDPQRPGGLLAGDITIRYEIAEDAAMQRIVQRGTAVAEQRFAHSVHAAIRGLRPGRSYWYRFDSGDAQSAVGLTRTTLPVGMALQQCRFGFVSCSNYEQGYFSAYRHLADEMPDVVLYLGDYIYEYIDRFSTDLVRRHSDNAEATDLQGYRNRYAQYRTDPDLQRLHATAPALSIWDDHEVSNDYGDLLDQNFSDPAIFKKRRAAAYQAFYEHMPITPTRLPDQARLRIYDRYQFGDLLQIHMTDARQYRSPAACYSAPYHRPGRMVTLQECPNMFDANRFMLGRQQEQWLQQGLSQSPTRWNVIGQSLLMARLRRRNASHEIIYWTDDWNGYPASRERLLRHIHESKVRNPVVLGGDIHSFWANDLKLDFDRQESPVVAAEFVTTSISAHEPTFDFAAALPENPHVRFFDKSLRGYTVCELDSKRMLTRLRAISDPCDLQAQVRTLREFIVEDGRPGIQQV